MKRLILCCALLMSSWAVLADEYDAALADFRAASGTEHFFSRAYGYAVFPTIGKGGFVIGGAYGEGRVYRAGVQTGTSSMTQLTIGFQLGGQAYSQIVFFRDQLAYERFTDGSFEFGAEASAVAVTLSAQARAGTTGASGSKKLAISKDSVGALTTGGTNGPQFGRS